MRPPGAQHRFINRNVVGFWLLGLVNNFSFVVILSAAEDLLAGYAGLILLCTILPSLISKLTISFWSDRIPYAIRICAVATMESAAMLIVARSQSVSLKLATLVMKSFIGSLGEISFLALTSHYAQETIGAWSSGTGASGIAGAGVYFLLRNILNFSAQRTLLLLAFVPLLLIVLFCVVLEPRTQSSVTGVGYFPLELDELEDIGGTRSSDFSATDRQFQNDPDTAKIHEPSEPMDVEVSSRISMFPTLMFQYILPLALVYFAEYTINQGVLGTLNEFWDTAGQPKAADKSHRLYTWFQLVYQVGVFVSRSSIECIQIRSIWIMPILQMVNLFVLAFSAMHALLPSAAVASVLIFWEGLLGGATYVNSFWKLRNTFPSRHREWALAVVPVGDTAGIAVAAVVSIWLEQFILAQRQ